MTGDGPAAPPTPATPGDEARIALCLGDVALIERGVYRLPERGPFVVVGAETPAADVARSLARRLPSTTAHRLGLLVAAYVAPVQASLRRLGIDKPVPVAVGDNGAATAVPMLAKTRSAFDPGPVALVRLDAERHFAPVEAVDSVDRPYGEKEDRLVWRGATTGAFAARRGPWSRGQRSFVPAVQARLGPGIDVRFSEIDRRRIAGGDVPVRLVRASLGGRLSMADMLRAKFLLSLEGNDVATNLKWVLWSNSVAVMPAPTAVSWACETMLREGTHVVRVRHDLLDLNKVFEACRSDDARCAAVAVQGRAFMAGFRDPAREARLMDAVVAEFARRVTVRDQDAGVAVPGFRPSAERVRTEGEGEETLERGDQGLAADEVADDDDGAVRR